MFSWITTALLKLIWFLIVQGPLNLISGIWNIIQYLTGDIFFDAIFGGKPTDRSPWPDSFGHHIPTAFYMFWILACFLVIIVFLVQYLILVFKDEMSTKERFMKSFKGALKAAGITIVIPVGFFFGIWIIEFLQEFIFRIFNVDDNQLADLLYHIGDPNFTGSLDASSTPSSFGAPDNIRSYNMIAEIVGTWFMLYACAMVGMAVAGKVFELYCLFIIGPIFAATYSIDDGNRFKIWKDAVLGKMAVSIGTILVFVVFITLLPVLFKLANQHNSGGGDRFSSAERIILYLLFILGGGTFVQTFPTFFANFFGESAGMAEGRAAAANAKAANGMLTAGAVGLGSALGIGAAYRKKHGGDGKAMNLAAGGELANAAANAGAGAAESAGKKPFIQGGLLGAVAGSVVGSGIKSVFGSKKTRAKARDDLKKKSRKMADKFTLRGVRSKFGGGNSKRDIARDMKRKKSDIYQTAKNNIKQNRKGIGRKNMKSEIKNLKKGMKNSKKAQTI